MAAELSEHSLAAPAMQSAGSVMSAKVDIADYRRMANFLYQIHHGHIIINVEGRPYLLDTGAPFSVGYEPILISGCSFPVEHSYLGITGSYLSEHIGLPIEGLLGADVLQQFNLGIYATERMVQFSKQRPVGDIVVPIQTHMGTPIVSVKIGDRVRRMLLDTGAPLSYLPPQHLADAKWEGRHEDFYPLLGNFLTNVYSQQLSIGGLTFPLTFGELPEELRPTLEAGNVEGILGTELLRHFALNLSLRDKVLCLELPHTLLDRAAS